MKVKETAELASADKYISIADLFNYFLTGNTFNEFTRFTTTILFNQKENKIENKIFDMLNLPKSIFPSIIIPSEKVGDLIEDLCSELETKPISIITANSGVSGH